MNIFKYGLKLSLLLMPFFSVAQNKTDHTGSFSFSPAFELLRSTHGNAFYAPSLKANYTFSNGFEAGVGLEYSTTPEHHDNGFVLYKLKFIPVYGNVKYNFKSDKQIRFYAETSLGVSFNKYDIADERTPFTTSRTTEEGLYLYTGFGAKYAISNTLNTFLGIGFKGYKMSTNDLDINPHGLSFMLGFTFF
ncbi:outer membrane beta-barrel protein [Pedobacter rhodius]|uniref:Outer membrane beta-barrel protein n=1 Tax=Pedobacter rhodius TaxID=3004098 RepID=A0ABT4KVX8_9SPHI|nr:outer membrane beta-barrel protein [Pedobacter sp. SJ11]MCZ4222392.1 outer membrane beta-barrel protein [Pedobacter sp. SJ11]